MNIILCRNLRRDLVNLFNSRSLQLKSCISLKTDWVLILIKYGTWTGLLHFTGKLVFYCYSFFFFCLKDIGTLKAYFDTK